MKPTYEDFKEWAEARKGSGFKEVMEVFQVDLKTSLTWIDRLLAEWKGQPVPDPPPDRAVETIARSFGIPEEKIFSD